MSKNKDKKAKAKKAADPPVLLFVGHGRSQFSTDSVTENDIDTSETSDPFSALTTVDNSGVSLVFKPKKIPTNDFNEDEDIGFSIDQLQMVTASWDDLKDHPQQLQALESQFWNDWSTVDKTAALLAAKLPMTKKINWLISTVRILLQVAQDPNKTSPLVRQACITNRIWLNSQEALNSFRDTFVSVLEQIQGDSILTTSTKEAWIRLIDTVGIQIIDVYPLVRKGELGQLHNYSKRAGKWLKYTTKLTNTELILYNESGLKTKKKTVELGLPWIVEDFSDFDIEEREFAFTLDIASTTVPNVHLAAESKKEMLSWKEKLASRIEALEVLREVVGEVKEETPSPPKPRRTATKKKKEEGLKEPDYESPKKHDKKGSRTPPSGRSAVQLDLASLSPKEWDIEHDKLQLSTTFKEKKSRHIAPEDAWMFGANAGDGWQTLETEKLTTSFKEKTPRNIDPDDAWMFGGKKTGKRTVQVPTLPIVMPVCPPSPKPTRSNLFSKLADVEGDSGSLTSPSSG